MKKNDFLKDFGIKNNMTREIKFRAWHSVAKSMSPVALNLLGIASQGAQAAEEKIDYRELLKNLIWLQFTGLKDKNGVEIYEGDIFQDEEDNSCEFVEWDSEFGGWSTQSWYSVGEFAQMAESLEIIGNIYENAELLNNK